MTIDEVKTRLADVIEHPENAEAFITDIGSDYDLLEASKAKIAEQADTISNDKKTIQAYVNSTLLTEKSEDVPNPEEEKTPQEVFNELFDKRFVYNKKE